MSWTMTGQPAFEDGKRSGTTFSAVASDCPFGHDQLELRDEWLRGFSAGRSSSMELRQPAPQRSLVDYELLATHCEEQARIATDEPMRAALRILVADYWQKAAALRRGRPDEGDARMTIDFPNATQLAKAS